MTDPTTYVWDAGEQEALRLELDRHEADPIDPIPEDDEEGASADFARYSPTAVRLREVEARVDAEMEAERIARAKKPQRAA